MKPFAVVRAQIQAILKFQPWQALNVLPLPHQQGSLRLGHSDGSLSPAR